MALLNFTQLYSKVKANNTDKLGLAYDTDNEFYKLYITGDHLTTEATDPYAGAGHIITHGIDVLKDYADGLRGMLPNHPYITDNTSWSLSKSYFRGDGWAKYWNTTDETTAGNTGNDAKKAYLQNTLVSAADILDWINTAYTTQQALRYKGVITLTTADGNTTIAGFPTTEPEVGDTYLISGSGTLLGEYVSSGDMIICSETSAYYGTDPADANKAGWNIVQDNVQHVTEFKFNDQSWLIYTEDQHTAITTFYAPNTKGAVDSLKPSNTTTSISCGQVLISKGTSTPEWVSQSSLVAGLVMNSLKLVHTDNTNISGLIAKTSDNTILGSTGGYNGAEDIFLSLGTASSGIIGGVKLDTAKREGNTSIHGFAIDHGTNKGNNTLGSDTLSIDANGVLYLDYWNIVNALGFEPISDLAGAGDMVVSSHGIGAADIDKDKALANATTVVSNPYINLINGTKTAVLASFKLTGSELDHGGIYVHNEKDVANVIFELQQATTAELGGTKLFYNAFTGKAVTNPSYLAENATWTNSGTTSTATDHTKGQFIGNDYLAVLLDKNGQMFVYAPWNHVFNGDNSGLVPIITDDNSKYLPTGETDLAAKGVANMSDETTFLLGSDGKYYKLPTTSFGSAWRPFSIGDAEGKAIDGKTTGTIADNPVANTDGYEVILSALSHTDVGGIVRNHAVVNMTLSGTTNDLTTDAAKAIVDIYAPWRKIFVDGVEHAADKDINFVTYESVAVAKVTRADDADDDDPDGIAFGLRWYNLDTAEYETVW